MKSESRLGDAVNLLLGLRPGWATPSDSGQPCFRPPRQPLTTFELNIQSDNSAEWGSPAISLHDNVEDLVSEVFNYRVMPFPQDTTDSRIPLGTLMLSHPSRSEVLRTLSGTLGVELSPEQAGGYLLVQLRRVTGECVYAAEQRGIGRRIRIDDYWTPAGHNAMGRLRVSGKIHDGLARDAVVTAKDAHRYLSFFYEFGTHFLSRVEVGDQIFQVFVCRPDRFRQLRNSLIREAGGLRVTGPFVVGCRVYTTSTFVSAAGRIVSVGNNEVLRKLLHGGRCHDEQFAGGDSILKILADGPAAVRRILQPLSQSVPIAMEFAPLSPYMGLFRACAFQRLLKGALLQRFGRGIQLPLGRNAAFSHLAHLPESPGFPAIGTTSTQIVQLKLNAGDCQFANADSVDDFSICSLLFEIPSGASILLPGNHLRICTYQTLAHSDDGNIPTIVLHDNAFESYEFITAWMQGALFVTDYSGTRRETIVDGFRFATKRTTGDAECGRVVLRGDLQTPTAETLRSMTGRAESFVAFVEAMLSTPTGQQPNMKRFARGYLEWLAVVLKGNRQHQKLRVRLLCLSRLPGSSAPMDVIPGSHLEFCLSDLAGIERIATRLESTMRNARMLIRARRYEDINAGPLETIGIGSVGEPFLELAGALETAGDQFEDALRAILHPNTESEESNSRTADDLRKVVEDAGRHLLDAVAETKAALDNDPASARAGTVLDAVSDIARLQPVVRSPVRPLAGEDSVARFWQYVQKFNLISGAVIAMEVAGDNKAGQPLHHVEQFLDTLSGTAELLGPNEWRDLPQLVSESLAALCLGCESARLESALRAFVDDAGDLISGRMFRARLWMQQYIESAREGPNDAGPDVSVPPAHIRAFDQECRLIKLLGCLWNLQDAAIDSYRLEKSDSFDVLNLPSTIHSLNARQRMLNQHVEK